MFKRILLLPTVFLLVLAVSLWTAPAQAAQSQQVPLNPKTIPQFVDPLPLLDVQYTCTPLVNCPTFPPVIETVVNPAAQVPIHMKEFKANVLSTGFVPPAGNLYAGTTVWGYRTDNATTLKPTYIGPVFVVPRGTPTNIRWVNNLPAVDQTNVLAWKFSTDLTLHWADPLNAEDNFCARQGTIPLFNSNCSLNYGQKLGTNPNPGPTGWNSDPIPAVVHLHGGEVPPVLDGGPDAWFTSVASKKGHGYYTSTVSGDTVAGNEAIYRYPNKQEAAPIWFHDHVLGITRLNVYAGLAGGYIIWDPAITPAAQFSGGTCTANCLPSDLGNVANIIPIVIQDRMFDTTGELFFPADTAGLVLWTPNPQHPYWVPEFVGDTIVVNGKTWPFLEVRPGLYRFLFLNGSNARTYELFLPNPITGQNVPLWVISNDGGYLDAPAMVQKLVIMPGERYGVIIDFAGIPAGTNLILKNTGRTPYPKGAPPNGATLGQIIQFRVTAAATAGVPQAPVTTFAPTATTNLRPTNALVRLANPATGLLATGVTKQLTRQLTLNEVLLPPQKGVTDPVTNALTNYPGGPLEILVNNSLWMGKFSTGSCRGDFTIKTFKAWNNTDITQCYSELPKEGETEVWEIINLTADAHPMHLHLVQFQVLNRQNFNTGNYLKAYALAFGGIVLDGSGPPYRYDNGDNPNFCATAPNTLCTGLTTVGGNPNVTLYLQGGIQLPRAQEIGWKDTVMALPGMVTRLAVRWAPTDLANNTLPGNAFFPFNPDGDHGYVWHCHIIDHEDNEMMRPTSVTALGGVSGVTGVGVTGTAGSGSVVDSLVEATLGVDFLAANVKPGLTVKNTTTSATGVITAVTKNTILTGSSLGWTPGDGYAVLGPTRTYVKGTNY